MLISEGEKRGVSMDKIREVEWGGGGGGVSEHLVVDSVSEREVSEAVLKNGSDMIPPPFFF